MIAPIDRNGTHAPPSPAPPDLVQILTELRQLHRDVAWLARGLVWMTRRSPELFHTSGPAAPVPPSVAHGLSPMEELVLAACTADAQSAKAIARKCGRSLNRTRDAIASLLAKGLVERTAQWGIRLRTEGGAR